MARRALVLAALSASCLRPAGFPWAASEGASSEGASTTSAAASEAPTTSSTSAGTDDTGSSSSTGPASSTGLATSAASTSQTSTSGGSSGSSGEPSSCGDGRLDPGEECDDGDTDDDDGCTAQCGRDRQIFVTSTIHSGDQIMGLEGGDTICAKAALAGSLPGEFKAWLSDRTTDAISRLHAGKGRYRRVDGLLVAASWAALLSGSLENPIVVTELDTIYENGVWTGTRPDGTHGVGADHCQDWTLADFTDPENGGFFGYALAFDAVWTYADEDFNPGPCGGELALYCVEQ